MIPAVNNELLMTNLEEKEIPSKDFRMNLVDENIQGKVTNLDEVRQSIFNILNTERYLHVIHSWDFGVETQDLIGQPVVYVCAELQRRIQEALLQDDRISSVSDFSFDTSQKGSVFCRFKASTKFGDVDSEKVVNY